MGASDFHSRWKVRGFFLLLVSLKEKHVWCLISAWHLTVFSDQSDKVYIYIYMCWPSGGAATRRKHTALSLSPSLSKAGFHHSYQIRRVPSSFFSFYLCVFFWTNSKSVETSPPPSELNSRKIPFQCQKYQPPDLTATSWTFSALPQNQLLWGIVAISFFIVSERVLL